MELIVHGRNLDVTDSVRDYVAKKIGRLNRHLSSIRQTRVDLAREHHRSDGDVHTAQVTIRLNGTILRGEESSHDLYAAIDQVLDKMHRQIDRYKGKRRDQWLNKGQVPAAPRAGRRVAEEIPPSGSTPRIVRRKRFMLLPMDEQDAIDQLELLGHDFLMFTSAETGHINVLYRRNDGNYGLIEPEKG